MKIMILLFIFNVSFIQAEDNNSWYEKVKSYSSKIADKAKEKTKDAIHVTKEYGSKALDTTKEYGSDAIETTKIYGSKAINTTKEYSIKAIDKTKKITKETIHDIKTDDVTFESFYKESSSLGWITLAVFALVSTAVAVYSGGTAAPALMAVAKSFTGLSAIGGLLGGTGLVGAAATTSGLAAIGGFFTLGLGSMAAGIVVVGAALTFGTGIVLDYAGTKALDSYSYNNFIENSKNMITLPLPKNTNGCDSYENAMSVLEEVDTEKPISSENSQIIIQKAIKVLDINESDIDNDEKAKKESLFALLYFVSNNYEESKKHANLSIELANKAEVKHTIPSYIFATSSLYDKTFDYNKLADNYLKYSFLEESDNPLIPLLLSIHMDRMMYRYSDGMIDEKALSKVFTIISDDSLKELRLQNDIIVLSRYIIAIKLEQQKISSLSTTENKTIKNSPKTLEVVKKSYKSYSNLLDGVDKVILALESIEVEDEVEIEAKKQVGTFKKLIGQYDNDKTRLQGLIKDLETYQASLSEDEIIETPSKSSEIEKKSDSKNIYIFVGLGMLLLIMIGYFLSRKRED